MGREQADPSRQDRPRRFWTRVRVWAILPYVAAVALVGVAVLVLGREVYERFETLEAWIADLGVWGPIVFVPLFVVLTSLFVPDSVLAIIAGALFGLLWGAVAVVVGGLLAASVQYALSHGILRNQVRKLVTSKPQLMALERAVRRRELHLQVLMRLTPLSPTLVSYLLGAAGVRFRGFFLALFALVPAYVVQVYFGYAGKHVARMAGRTGPAELRHDALLLAGLALCIIVLVLITWMARKAIKEAEEEVGVVEAGAAAGAPGQET